jgi:hypothetical protein
MSDESMETNVEPSVESEAPVSEPEGMDSVEPAGADTTVQPETAPMDNVQPMGPTPDQSAELAAERRARAEAEARAEAYQNVYSQQMTAQQQADLKRQEEERLLNMSPEERLIYAAEQQERRLQQMTLDAERRIMEANDRAAYAALKNENPLAATMENDVEQFVADQRAQGNPIDREVALTYLAGKKALEAARRGNSASPQRQAAQQNVQASRVETPNPAGDVSSNKEADVDEKALRNERLAQGKRGSSYR